jgi:TatD DNase family protein
MLVDSHCHLTRHADDGDLDDVIARARRAGVGTMVTICTRLDEFPAVRGIAEAHDDIWCSVGVHPHDAADAQDVTVRELVELATHPKVVGIGESGLDYYYEHSDRAFQKRSFLAHIDAARQTGLPLIVHSRDADDDMIGMLGDAQADGPFPGLIHCFTSGPELAEKALEIGFYISFSGIVSFKNALSVQEVAQHVPLDRILVETDAPYLAPVPKRGKRNEPAYVVHVAEAVARLRGVEPEELAMASTQNFARVFNRVTLPDKP